MHIVFLFLLGSVLAHSTKYKVSDAPPSKGAPEFFSYHAHILYLQNNANNTQEAMKLYEVSSKKKISFSPNLES